MNGLSLHAESAEAPQKNVYRLMVPFYREGFETYASRHITDTESIPRCQSNAAELLEIFLNFILNCTKITYFNRIYQNIIFVTCFPMHATSQLQI